MPAPKLPKASLLTAQREIERLRETLTEIERLRLATNDGSLRARADRMWELAVAALAAGPAHMEKNEEND